VENAVTPVDLVASEPRVVNLAAIERELVRSTPSVEASHEERAPHALMGNLIIVSRHAGEESAIAQEIPAIVSQYPSRVLLLVADAGSRSTEIEASVTIQERLRGTSRQVCGEVVTIRVGAPEAPRLASTVRAVLLGDLPTTLWWATAEAPPLAGDLFVQLSDLADQVIYDSFAWADPLRQLVTMATWVGGTGRRGTADLAWRRQKLWRRIISQSLEPSVAPGAIEAIREVQVEHGPHALTQAWLLAGWLAFRLGWAPRGGKVVPGPEVSWSFEWAHGAPRVEIKRLRDSAPDLQSIRILTRANARAVTFRFELEAPGRITVVADGLSDRTLWLTGPVHTCGQLVARQLPDLGRDRLFESSMALARTMAETVL
jgi:glucose-6-phosphate dehydrogenase assembly protein OpcA